MRYVRALPFDPCVTVRYHVRYQQKGSDMKFLAKPRLSMLDGVWVGVAVNSHYYYDNPWWITLLIVVAGTFASTIAEAIWA